jgi:hypothetical protein
MRLGGYAEQEFVGVGLLGLDGRQPELVDRVSN